MPEEKKQSPQAKCYANRISTVNDPYFYTKELGKGALKGSS